MFIAILGLRWPQPKGETFREEMGPENSLQFNRLTKFFVASLWAGCLKDEDNHSRHKKKSAPFSCSCLQEKAN